MTYGVSVSKQHHAIPRRMHSIYELYGLHVRSDVPLALPPSSLTDFDVELRLGGTWNPDEAPVEGTVVASVSLGNGGGYTHTATETGFSLRFHGTAEFRVDRACRVIEACLAPGVEPDFVPILFAGNVLAFVLTIRDHAVMHASAVEVGSEVLAFVGSSGMGKSTMAAVFCAAGAGLVTDDVLRLDLNGGIGCHAGASELRLREAASDLARYFPSNACRRTADGRMAVRLPGPSATVTPLRAIVIPKPSRDASDLRCTRLSPREAFLALISHPRVLGWKGREQLRRQVEWLGIIANRIPVFEAVIPWGPPFAEDLSKHMCRYIGLGNSRTF